MTEILESSSWAPVDMAAVLDEALDPPQPVILRRDDWRGLLYPGMLHVVIGESESLKSWLCLLACLQAIINGRPALYVDFESTPQVAASRLIALGADKDSILNGLIFVRPTEALDGAGIEALVPVIREDPPAVVVIDGLNEALALHGADMNSATDVGRFYRLLPRKLARTGAAVMMTDHPVKNREDRGRWASGSQHKGSAADVAYTVELVKPFGIGRRGVARIRVSKDRPGVVRGFAVDGSWAADLHLESRNGGAAVTLDGQAEPTVNAELRSPPKAGDEDVFMPTRIMEQISRAIEKAGDKGLSVRAIRGAVRGKDDVKSYAVELLANGGYINREKGPNRAVVHRHVKRYTSVAPGATPDGDDGWP